MVRMKTVVQMLEKDKVDYVFEHLVVALGRMRCGTGISFHQLKRHLGYGSILYNGIGGVQPAIRYCSGRWPPPQFGSLAAPSPRGSVAAAVPPLPLLPLLAN